MPHSSTCILSLKLTTLNKSYEVNPSCQVFKPIQLTQQEGGDIPVKLSLNSSKKNLHWIHDADPCPFSCFSINFVTHDCSSQMMGMNSEGKWEKGQNTVFHLTACVPKF